MSKNKVTVDTEALLAAVARSTGMAAALEETSARIAGRAKQIASVEANATGTYASKFVHGVVPAAMLRAGFRGKSRSVGGQRGRQRRRSGAFSDAIEGTYNGAVGVVGSTSFLGWFIEFGTYNRPGKSILQRAATETTGGAITGTAGFTGSKLGNYKAAAKRSGGRARSDRKAEAAFRAEAAQRGVNVSKSYFRNLRKTGKAPNMQALAKKQGL